MSTTIAEALKSASKCTWRIGAQAGVVPPNKPADLSTLRFSCVTFQVTQVLRSQVNEAVICVLGY